MKIIADATLPDLQKILGTSFELTLYHTHEELEQNIAKQDILLCRSTLPVSAKLLAHSSIQCVATASSGSDHIDKNYLQQQGITLLDARGSNAQAVADYVLSTMAILLKTKKTLGNRVGIIGMGEVGTQVSRHLAYLGFELIYFDPPKAILSTEFSSCQFDQLLACDILCIHANLHDTPPYPSRNLLGKDFFSCLTQPLTIINAARGGIIDEQALLNTPKQVIYCTDVYVNEPEINEKIIDFATLCTPHIAGHSIEAKQAAVMQIAQQLHDHFKITAPIMLNPQPLVESHPINQQQHWIETVLSLYNPMDETLYLKKANDKKQAFLTLRKAHNHRHDFTFYNANF